MDATHVHETYVNRTEGYSFGSDDYELAGTVFEDKSPGDVFRWLRDEYGRCVGKAYRDTSNGPVHCGWVFVSRQRYEDTGEPYLREVWVTFTREVEPARPALHEPFAVSSTSL